MKLSTQTLEDLKDSALGFLKSTINDMVTLQAERTDAFNAYLSKPFGNEIDGRSQFVTSDLSDVIESIMPSLMRTFYGSSNVVAIQPVGPEDETAAKLIEEKINYDFQTGINGYKVMDTWFRDSLYQKIGVVKYYWLKTKEYKTKEYDDLTEAEYMNLLQQVDAGKFEITKEEVETEQEAVYDEFGQVVQTAQVKYCVTGRKVQEISKPIVENIPPEEFIFDIKSKSIEDCKFVAHKKRVHKTYVQKYGVSDADIVHEHDSYYNDSLYLTRFEDLGGIRFFRDENDPDYIFIYECYLNHFDKDGTKKPMKMVIMGNKVIDYEENKYGRPPFCVLTPIAVPHRMVGRDFADMVVPIQRLHSSFVRFIADNLGFQNNGVRVVDPFKVNLDDLVNENIPGGIIRLKQPGEPSRAIANITPTPVAPEVYALIDKMETIRQERTGVTKYNSGMDSKSLNRTATGISQIMNAANQRVELLARNYAETGVKELFQALVDMNLDFFDAEVALKLNGQWRQITPDQIDGRFDILVDVGAAMGTAEVHVQQMLQALNVYQGLNQSGIAIPSKYFYNILQQLWTKWGYKSPQMYAPGTDTIIQDMQEQMAAMQQLAPQQPPMPPQGMPPQAPPERMQ